jgi:hypothetical protein
MRNGISVQLAVKLVASTQAMNIYQMRHAILAKHTGERFTPTQLKVELLAAFPSVKPQSVNASDCHYSARKRAGSTCPECGKLGGFAVNRDGVVDMGAAGWGNISSVHVPTENTRSSVGSSAEISMADPLVGFDWKTVCDRYAAACCGFNPTSQHLRGFYAGTDKDRFLYYKLVGAAVPGNRSQLGADWYEALLYWKLYSSRFSDSQITKWLQGFSSGHLQQFLAKIPTTIPRKVQDVLDLVELVGRHQFPGMKSRTALPVRTAFLHILYPNIVPILDQMVLKAVGPWRDGANQDISVLRHYIPHAWALADKYTQQLSSFRESPIRLVDMALWVKRS